MASTSHGIEKAARQLKQAEEIVAELRRHMIGQGLSPILVARAMLHDGVFETMVGHLTPKQSELVLRDMTLFIEASREVFEKHAFKE